MAKCLIRVVLHDGKTEDYLELYKYMDEKGFTDVISLKDKTKRKLPDGEYLFDVGGAEVDIENVKNILKAALSKLDCEYSYTLAKVSGVIKTYNLEKVQ